VADNLINNVAELAISLQYLSWLPVVYGLATHFSIAMHLWVNNLYPIYTTDFKYADLHYKKQLLPLYKY